MYEGYFSPSNKKMLKISQSFLDQIIEHVKSEHPLEACGILAGKNGDILKIYKMINTDKSRKTYFMDPKEQLRVFKDIRVQEIEMMAIYHSHPHSQAYPSKTDVELAFYSDASYMIVSLEDMNNPVVRSYKITYGKIEEEEINLC
jgi:proteasome lid subunit RPN8/RPN11